MMAVSEERQQAGCRLLRYRRHDMSNQTLAAVTATRCNTLPRVVDTAASTHLQQPHQLHCPVRVSSTDVAQALSPSHPQQQPWLLPRGCKPNNSCAQWLVRPPAAALPQAAQQAQAGGLQHLWRACSSMTRQMCERIDHRMQHRHGDARWLGRAAEQPCTLTCAQQGLKGAEDKWQGSRVPARGWQGAQNVQQDARGPLAPACMRGREVRRRQRTFQRRRDAACGSAGATLQ